MSLKIDWSIFDNMSENVCYCRCGAVYNSHTKIIKINEDLALFSQKPCPKCGKLKNHLRRVCSPPEIETIC